jgi:hypothetical protein
MLIIIKRILINTLIMTAIGVAIILFVEWKYPTVVTIYEMEIGGSER